MVHCNGQSRVEKTRGPVGHPQPRFRVGRTGESADPVSGTSARACWSRSRRASPVLCGRGFRGRPRCGCPRWPRRCRPRSPRWPRWWPRPLLHLTALAAPLLATADDWVPMDAYHTGPTCASANVTDHDIADARGDLYYTARAHSAPIECRPGLPRATCGNWMELQPAGGPSARTLTATCSAAAARTRVRAGAGCPTLAAGTSQLWTRKAAAATSCAPACRRNMSSGPPIASESWAGSGTPRCRRPLETSHSGSRYRSSRPSRRAAPMSCTTPASSTAMRGPSASAPRPAQRARAAATSSPTATSVLHPCYYAAVLGPAANASYELGGISLEELVAAWSHAFKSCPAVR